MKKVNRSLSLLLTAALAVLPLTSCNRVKFEPFQVKDTGPKIYLMTGVNQLENGDFSSGSTHWGDFCSQGGSASIDYTGGKASIQIKNQGSENYAVQFYYDGIRTYHDGQYVLSFTASSTVSRPCEVRIQLNGGDYHAYAMDTFIFTPEEQRFTISFTMQEESDASPRLAFNMGKFTDFQADPSWDGKSTVTIKDVEYMLNNVIATEEEGNGGADFVRVNQLGFRPQDTKAAYVKVQENGLKFQVLDASGTTVYSGSLQKPVREELALEYVARADFTKVTEPGIYTVQVGENQSFPFVISENPYDSLMLSALRFYYLARCGTEVTDDIFGHVPCHTAEAVSTNRRFTKDVSGGWHDAGDYGRYVVPAAKTLADLLIASQNLAGSSVNYDILEECRWELDWLFKMQQDDGGVFHKATCSKFNSFDMPETELNTMFISPVSSCATADFAAIMAYASTFYKGTDPAYADSLLKAAEKAWNYIESNKFKEFKNESFISTGEYPDKFGDDEKYFAAAALTLATGNIKYAQAAEQLRASTEAAQWKEQFGWEQMEGYGDAIILANPVLFSADLVKTVRDRVIAQADAAVKIAQNSGFRQAQEELNWGSNMEAMNIAILLNLAYSQTSKSVYREMAMSQVDYIMGANPASRCYVTGYGSNSPIHPHHRPSIAKDIPQKGMLVGGPDQMLEDEFAVNLLSDKPPLLCHVDNYQSFSTNEITIYWNSPLILALSQLYY